MDNNIGKKLDGRYELLELIGVGGMADIYKAKDITEDKIVAVKILKNEFVGSEDFIRRFRNESKAIALLSHPNIVKIFDVGFTEKLQFIVMEYIDGITLTDYIAKQGVLKWRDVVHFTMQILKALQHAHDRGIVHRDIKPQNVMLLSDGTIKVMDFGIARFNRETDKTVSDKAIGSVHYISPEQARGDVTDERSDIYSIGVMMYEMLTGKKPFDGDSPVSIALMHMQSQAKKMSEINNSIPEGLEEITEKAMQKEPSKRYQTAGEMMKDIEEFKQNPSIVFEYKYFSTDGTTKYFDRVAPETVAANGKENGVKDGDVKKKGFAINLESEEGEEDEDLDDEVAPRRSPLLSILFAVTAVFVIVATLVVYKIVSDTIPNEENTQIEEVVVPTFLGLTDEELEDRYGDKFRIRMVSENSPEPKGKVIGQSIGAGTSIKSTQLITVTISLGPKMEEIDEFASRPLAEAKTQLENQGFVVEVIKQDNDTVPAGYVIKTDPPARSREEIGTKVTIFVSQGQAPTLTVVPDFRNISEYAARQNAERHDIVLIVDYKPDREIEKNKVISQSIEPNEKVEKGTLVTIVVSSGPPNEASDSITLNLNAGINQDFRFKYYIDNVLMQDLTETRNMNTSQALNWEITNSGTHEYMIMVEHPETGMRKVLISYEINFDTDPITKTQLDFNANVFSELSAGAETTVPETTPTPTLPPETLPPETLPPETAAAVTEPEPATTTEAIGAL